MSAITQQHKISNCKTIKKIFFDYQKYISNKKTSTFNFDRPKHLFVAYILIIKLFSHICILVIAGQTDGPN